jgi:hypothetical protein
VEADVWIEPSKSAYVLSHLPFSRREIPSRVKDAFGTQDSIHIHSEWMEGIGTLPNASFYEAMLNYYEKDLDRYTLQKVLALQVIDAIADVGTARIASPEPVEKFWFPIDIAVITRYVYTYAFDLTSSPGIPIAFSILLLHALMILVHLILILTSKNPWHGSSWESFGDMLMLALRSKAPIESEDIRSKHPNSKPWATPAIIRTEGEEGRQQIFLKDGHEY